MTARIALVIAFLLAGCAAPPTPLTAFTLTAPTSIPARLTGTGARDWSYGRYGGPAFDAARRAARPAGAERRLLAFGATTGWTTAGTPGLALTAFGVTGVSVNAPAWAYRSPTTKLVGRVWFLTSTGWLLGLDRTDPLNVADANKRAITIDLRRPVSRGAVALSDDGRRAYVVTDDGTLCAADLEAGTFTTASLGGPAVGASVCVDPLLSDANSLTGPDYLFTLRNDGTAFRFRWQAGSLTQDGGSTRGVAADRALDGSTTDLVACAPVAWNGVLYYGDRSGRMNVLDWRTAAPSLSATFVPGAGPIEAAAGLRFDGLDVRDVFVSAGARVAWQRLPLYAGEQGWTVLSRALVIDGAPGAASEGALDAYPLRGTRVVARPADEAATAIEAAADPGLALPGLAGDRPVRTASVGAAHVVDATTPVIESVYGQPNQPAAPTAGADVRSLLGDPAAGLAGPLGLAVGPEGEVYVGGKYRDATLLDDRAHEGDAVWVIPARPMANRWGWPTLDPGRLYPIAGPGAQGGAGTSQQPELREPHGVWHDDAGTATAADDALWFAEWRGNAVRRVGPDGATAIVMGAGGGAAGAHPTSGTWPARTPLGRPHAVCVARGGADPGAVFVAEADHPHLLRYDAATDRAAVAVALPAPATALWHDRATDSVYVASRTGHRVWRYDLQARTLTGVAGTGVAGHDPDGAAAIAARLDGPDAIAVHPTTGEVYVGEALGDGATGRAGCRVKVVQADGTLWTVAGDGGLAMDPDGRPATASGLGRVAGLAFGPADLTDGTADPAEALYLTARDAHAVARLRFPSAGAATPANRALGFLQWRLGDAFAGRSLLEATVRLVAAGAPAGDPARPELAVAGAAYSDGTPGPWTAAGLRPGNLPSIDASARAAFDEGTGPETPVRWQAGRRYGWTLPAERLPTDGTIALALLPPDGAATHHFPHGSGFTAASGHARAIDFHGTADAAQAPTLDAFVSDYHLAGGLASPPSIASSSSHVFAMNANALFRLDATDPASFTGTARYAATRIGRRADGSLDTTAAPTRFVLNPTAPLVTLTNKVYALELKNGGASWDFGVARFDGSAAPGAMLTNSLGLDGKAAPDQTYRAGTFATWDGFGNDFGFLYFGLGDGRVYRVGL